MATAQSLPGVKCPAAHAYTGCPGVSPHAILKGTSEPRGGYAGLGKCGIFLDEIKKFLAFSLRRRSSYKKQEKKMA